MLIHNDAVKSYHMITLIFVLLPYYSLAPGVSFDLLQRLYKLEHPTLLCCSALSDTCTVGQI